MAQVGLPDLAALPPALVETVTGDGMYRYQLHSDFAGTITVDKRTGDGGWEPAYAIVAGACSCPGYAHRADCKHADIGRALRWYWAERTAPSQA